MTSGSVTVDVPFFRRKKAKSDAFSREPQSSPGARPLRVAQTLALAHGMKALLDQGTVRDQTRLAEVMGVTRMRVSQLLNLTLLAPEIQEDILFATTDVGCEPLTERDLRPIVRERSWPKQRSLWDIRTEGHEQRMRRPGARTRRKVAQISQVP